MQRQYTLFVLFGARLTSYLSFLFLFSNSLSALKLSLDKTNCLLDGGNFVVHRGKDIIDGVWKHPWHTYKTIYYRGQWGIDNSARICKPLTWMFSLCAFAFSVCRAKVESQLCQCVLPILNIIIPLNIVQDICQRTVKLLLKIKWKFKSQNKSRAICNA